MSNHIEKANIAYKVRSNNHREKMEFSLGDLVWLHLKKERFLSKRKNKSMVRGDGPLKVIERVGDNTYKL